MTDQFSHIPVLAVSEGAHHPSVFEVLCPKPGDSVLDVTLGLGGHLKMFLEHTAPDGTAIALDADEANIALATKHLKEFGKRVKILHANFSELPHLELPKVDIIFADIGLSSPHLDDASRGFTFREDAPLDMRFDRTKGMTAAQLLSKTSFDDLRRILREYADLKEAGYLARAITERTQGKEPQAITTTQELVNVCEKVMGWRTADLLPRIFQALRIAVNDELGALEVLLAHGPDLLQKNGRMGVISFHSLEDRFVKQRFRDLTTAPIDERTGQDLHDAPFELLTKKAIVAGGDEVRRNPRARSAKFRAIRKR